MAMAAIKLLQKIVQKADKGKIKSLSEAEKKAKKRLLGSLGIAAEETAENVMEDESEEKQEKKFEGGSVGYKKGGRIDGCAIRGKTKRAYR